MTVNDLISRLKIELSDIVLSNDERYLITLFESNLSVVYKRYLNKYLTIPNAEITLKVKINHNETDSYLKTEAIPNLIRTNYGHAINYIGFDQFSIEPLTYKRTIEEFTNSGYNPILKHVTYCTLSGNILLINNRYNPIFKLNEFIYIKGYWESPSEVLMKNENKNNLIDIYTLQYPVPSDLLEYTLNIIKGGKLNPDQ